MVLIILRSLSILLALKCVCYNSQSNVMSVNLYFVAVFLSFMIIFLFLAVIFSSDQILFQNYQFKFSLKKMRMSADLRYILTRLKSYGNKKFFVSKFSLEFMRKKPHIPPSLFSIYFAHGCGIPNIIMLSCIVPSQLP